MPKTLSTCQITQVKGIIITLSTCKATSVLEFISISEISVFPFFSDFLTFFFFTQKINPLAHSRPWKHKPNVKTLLELPFQPSLDLNILLIVRF